MTTKHYLQRGFTIVELLIVIVIIGILATISIVAYNGVQQSARDKSILSDLDSLDAIETQYALQNNVIGKAYYSGSGVDATLGFTPSPGNVIDVVIDSSDYCIRGYNLQATKNSINNAATKESSTGACARIAASSLALTGLPPSITCPAGFIVVPGSSTYGTSDFCVMKYEAKNVSGVATSQAAGTPWVSITQTTALSIATVACSGCHLITEAEWLTIAQNVLSVANNWSNGAIGPPNYIYSGHNDNGPANSLAADSNDNNGYSGTGNSGTSNQRRTLTLTNGEVIWDLAGNVWEWTSGTTTGGQPGASGYAYRQWNALSVSGSLYPSPYPSYANPGAASWTSSQGIGQVYSNSDETAVRGFLRGGDWIHGGYAGVLTLTLGYVPGAASASVGFRVSR